MRIIFAFTLLWLTLPSTYTHATDGGRVSQYAKPIAPVVRTCPESVRIYEATYSRFYGPWSIDYRRTFRTYSR